MLHPQITPPVHWRLYTLGSQRRAVSADGRAAIVVSPVVPHTHRLPTLALLAEATLDSEALVSFEVVERGRPQPIHVGRFTGVQFDVTGYTRPYRPVERRLYVLVSDGRFVYCLTYIATPTAFVEHFQAFASALASLETCTATFVEPVVVASANPFAD